MEDIVEDAKGIKFNFDDIIRKEGSESLRSMFRSWNGRGEKHTATVDTAPEKQSSLNNRNGKIRTNRRMEGQNAHDTYASADELSESFNAADAQGTRELRETERVERGG